MNWSDRQWWLFDSLLVVGYVAGAWYFDTPLLALMGLGFILIDRAIAYYTTGDVLSQPSNNETES